MEVSRLPDALAEARMALELTDPDRPLICFSNIELIDFLIRRPDKAALRLVPDWAGTRAGTPELRLRPVPHRIVKNHNGGLRTSLIDPVLTGTAAA